MSGTNDIAKANGPRKTRRRGKTGYFADPTVKRAVTEMIAKFGLAETARRLDVSREIPLRVKAGHEIRLGSLTLVEQNLNTIDLDKVG